MALISFEKILKIVEVLCKVLLASLGAIGVVNASSDFDENAE